jgi:hypothetical protein
MRAIRDALKAPLGLRRYPVALLAALGLATGGFVRLVLTDPATADRIFFMTLVAG